VARPARFGEGIEGLINGSASEKETDKGAAGTAHDVLPVEADFSCVLLPLPER